MALQIQVEVNNSGISANYIRIEDMSYVRLEDELRISLGLYKDKASRDSGKNPISMLTAQLPNVSNNNLTGANLIEMIYNKIKELPEFSEAVDV